ncbi:MAG TPA: GNAT family N-acetyltransferase [Gemmatimonadales bacterium]|nr:GNAT family N-acetyltransferase [Gemmatimonadales bacterium]
MPETQLDSIPVPALPGERVIAAWDGTEILLVTQASSERERALAEQVARRAMRDTPFDTPAYTAQDPDPALRAFLAREAGQAVGLAVLRPRRRWAWWGWDEFDAERRPATGVAPLPTWAVELIWTHGAGQHRGLGRRLLTEASRVVDQPITSFAWRRPFTPSGEAFVRRLCPEGFWVPE